MMKRLYAILLICAALVMALPALAEDQDPQAAWDESCNWVIAYDVTLCDAVLKSDLTDSTTLYDFIPAGEIAQGTKVSIRSSYDGMREIAYWADGQAIGWVEADAVIWDGGASILSGEEAEPAPTFEASNTWQALEMALIIEDGTEIPVILQELGSAQCVVFDGENLLTVATADLRWATVDPVEDHQRLAMIYAPKTGKATLRASASTSAKSLGQCQEGRLVVVLKVGSTFTRVLYEGQEGCVLTDALAFLGVVPKDSVTAATLSYNGRTDTSATISVYTAETAKRKIDQWRVGNEVIVLNRGEQWSEIELEGWHGWVKTEYLQ